MAWLLQAVLLLIAVYCSHSNPINQNVHHRMKRQLGSGSGTCAQADIVFILDSSGSIGEDNWEKVLNFTKDIIDNFTIGTYDTHVGLVLYATSVDEQKSFGLTKYTNKTELLEVVGGLPWKDEETNTSGAIRYARQQIFVQSNGARPNSPYLAIVITDGAANRDTNLTKPEADALKNEGVTIMALGIGQEFEEHQEETIQELKDIATNDSYVFTVDNFDGLDELLSQVAAVACDIPVECNRPADITFILDSSGSVSGSNFERMKNFVNETIELINVDFNNSNVALITFGDNATLEFGLNQYDTRTKIQQAVMNVPYRRGSTNTAAALKMAREQVYIESRGDRRGVQNIALLFTDGGSNQFDDTLEQAKLLRTSGVTVIVITVTTWINMNEVREIASDPDDRNVLTTSFVDISDIRFDIKDILCDKWDECQGDACGEHDCYNGVNKFQCTCPPGTGGISCQHVCEPVDVVVAVDSSGSIGETNYYQVLGFIKEFAENMNFNPVSGARMGLVTFANDAAVKFHLNEYSTRDEVSNAISFKYSAGTTNTASALLTMREAMFTSSRGDRVSARNVGIIVTDGESNDRDVTFEEAAKAREAGIDLISVAINMRTPKGQLEVRGIATDPDDRNVLNAPSFRTLSNFTDTLVMAVCNSVNECASSPCEGGGVCVDTMNGYHCICPDDRSGAHCERQCDGRADIVFVVDTSGSIRENRFAMVRNYIVSVINELEIGQDKVRVGLIAFSDDAEELFKLNQYMYASDVTHAVMMMPYTRGRTATAAAIHMAYDQAFTPESGDRFDVPNYAVIITDGESTVEPEMTLPEAIEARIRGVHLIAVTVGPSANSLEMRGIASDPDEFNMYSVERFEELVTQSMPLVNGMCDTVNECASDPCMTGQCFNGLGQYFCACDDRTTGINCERQCTRRGDVVFVLDSSGSVEKNFEIAQTLAKRIVHGLNFEGDRTRVGVVVYSSDAHNMFNLRKYNTKEEVLNAITFTVDRQRTNTAAGITMMRDDMFTANSGDRNGDQNWAIVITDGRSNMQQDMTRTEALRAHDDGIKIFAVGIGENGQVDRMEINDIASDPDNLYAYIMEPEDDLDIVANAILDVMCS